MKTYFAAALLISAEAVKIHSSNLGLDYVPAVRDYLYEYPGVDGHLN